MKSGGENTMALFLGKLYSVRDHYFTPPNIDFKLFFSIRKYNLHHRTVRLSNISLKQTVYETIVTLTKGNGP